MIDLVWDGDLRFTGTAGDLHVVVDSDAKAGPSPMQYLAFALAGCMAVDVVHILKKGRHDLRGLRGTLTGTRAETEPRRFTSIDLRFVIRGPVPAAQAERAVALSRDKYCSVWHSLRQDIDFTVTVALEP